jgi:hypothetical protein
MIGFGASSSFNPDIDAVPECSILRRSGLRLVINIGIKLIGCGDEGCWCGLVGMYVWARWSCWKTEMAAFFRVVTGMLGSGLLIMLC